MAEHVIAVTPEDLYPLPGPLDWAIYTAALQLRVSEQAVRDAIELGKVLERLQVAPLSMQIVDGRLYWTNGGTIYCTPIELPVLASGDCEITMSWGQC